MTKPIIHLDCCETPALATARLLLSTEVEMMAVRKCRHCGCCWYYVMRTCENRRGDYDRQSWFVRLSADEAESLTSRPGVPDPQMFAGRPGFLRDADGLQRIEGLPYFLA
jgi:hypothetical protein